MVVRIYWSTETPTRVVRRILASGKLSMALITTAGLIITLLLVISAILTLDAPKPIIPATTISKEAVPEPPSSDHTSAVLLAEEKLKRLCMSINGLPRTLSEHKPKVYDYIVYQGYLDHLEIRLNTLAAHVHTFVIVYHKTHQLSKLEHNPRIAPFWKQLVFIPITEGAILDVGMIRNEGIPALTKLNILEKGDLLLVSDVMEIVRGELLDALVLCGGYPDVVGLGLDHYYYSYQYASVKVQNRAAKVIRVQDRIPEDVQALRDKEAELVLPKAGWACTLCFQNFGDLTRLGLHEKDNATLLNGVRYGYDVTGSGDLIGHVESNHDLPPYLLKNRGQFEYLVNRRNEYSGFVDIQLAQNLEKFKHNCNDLSGITRTTEERIPQVVDYFLYSGEKDMLEVRLNTIGPYVDYFILAEPIKSLDSTHPLQFNSIKEDPLFSKYTPKIMHVPITPDPAWTKSKGKGPHDHRLYYRNHGLTKGLESIPIQDGDILLVTDVTEIPRPNVIESLKSCSNYPSTFTLNLKSYQYGFEYQHAVRTAGLAKAHVWNSSEAVTAEDIRHAHENGRNKPVDVWNAGWACSWCYSTFKETLEKAEAHPLSAVVGTKENIVRAVKWGVDVFGRSDVRYIHVQDNMDLPDWVLAKRDRFSFLLNRRNEFAGFVDLREESKAEAAAAAAAKVVKPK